MANLDPGHDDGLRADPHIVADDGIARRQEAIAGTGEFGRFRQEGKREAADPVIPVALIAGHDESGTRSDGTEAADNQLVGAGVGQQIAGAIIEAVPVIIARIITVGADDDIGMSDLLVEWDALERAFEEIGHDDSHEG
ncbi:hypothetical protein D9M68_846630 [compost metagenome]